MTSDVRRDAFDADDDPKLLSLFDQRGKAGEHLVKGQFAVIVGMG